MAEIFGAVVASVTVCHELSRLANKIRKVTKKIQNAPLDIATLSDEMDIFTGQYETFLQVCEDNPDACTRAAPSIKLLESWTNSTIKSLHTLLEEVDALRLDTNYRYSISYTVAAHLKWLFSTNSVNVLRASLSVARQNINGFSNLMCFEQLIEELRMFRSALKNEREREIFERKLGMKLEDKIQLIENRL
jgi:hypothetical protein